METTAKTARVFLALGDTHSSATAAAAIQAATGAVGYAGSIGIDSRHWDIAHACGLSRTLIKKLRGRKAFESRGTDDERIDTEGALAEVLVAMLLEPAGAEIAPLVGHKPACSVDMHLDGKSLDIKSIGQGRRLAVINCRAHAAKPADAYLFVHFVRADVADLYVVAAAGVAGWQRVEFLRGVPLDPRRYYYSSRLPLEQLEALPEEVEA